MRRSESLAKLMELSVHLDSYSMQFEGLLEIAYPDEEHPSILTGPMEGPRMIKTIPYPLQSPAADLHRSIWAIRNALRDLYRQELAREREEEMKTQPGDGGGER